MTKRITALLVALVIPITLLFAGCGKQLTEQEYFDELSACYKEYSTAFKELMPIVEASKDNVATVKSNSAKAKDICGRVDKALTKFEKLKPPSQFSAQHKKLVTSIANERKFVKAAENLFAADTLDSLLSATKELQEAQNVPADQQFPSVFLQLIKDVKNVL